MVRRIRLVRGDRRHKGKGQSLVEFALISVVLFMVLLGIIEGGRFLFVYSMVTNSAQEGARYGIVRPREVMNMSEYRTRTARGTAVPTQLVVADGNCNVVQKAAEKVWGVARNDVNIKVRYDNGNGTPTPVTSSNVNQVVIAGNRIVVESSYTYQFIIPFISKFSPNGVEVRMVAARTMMNNGDGSPPPCEFTGVIAPTPNLSATQTAVAGITQTAIAMFTPTPTSTVPPTPTRTPTPALVIRTVDGRKETGGAKPLYARVYVTDNSPAQVPVPDVQVQVTVMDCTGSPCVSRGTATLPSIGSGFYRSCPVGNYDGDPTKLRLDIVATDPFGRYASGAAFGSVIAGNTCP